MLHQSPLRTVHDAYVQSQASQTTTSAAQRPGAAAGVRLARAMQYIPYGVNEAAQQPLCEIPADFGSVEIEYATIRRAAGVMDCPHRGTLMITGDPRDRREFLSRMLTQELKDLGAGTTRASFWLNRKGRIDADLFLIELGDFMMIDLDINQSSSAAQSLAAFIVMEDLQIENVSTNWHHLAVHGRRAHDIIAETFRLDRVELESGHAASLTIAGAPTVIARRDQTAEPGFELMMPREHAVTVWNALVQHDAVSNQNTPAQNQARPIGWHAFNIARIEAGTPLFNVDFGPNNVPHETGILHERVSFTKGCYLGQEIVARMENLGKPKQRLVGLRMKEDLLPTAGEQVFEWRSDQSMGDEIGVVTSSTLSPMLGAAPIAFAMIRFAHANEGAAVLVNAEGAQSQAMVSPLRFWPATRESHT